jgi:hypothetical protein
LMDIIANISNTILWNTTSAETHTQLIRRLFGVTLKVVLQTTSMNTVIQLHKQPSKF